MAERNKRLIGLTGGIGTGKSTVTRYLTDTYNLSVLDGDIYAREAVKSGSPVLEEIFQRYGERVKFPDGTLNRRALGDIIFNDDREKSWLESKIHPQVRECFESAIRNSTEEVLVLAIPLLFEANMVDLTTEIWVVDAPKEKQISRLIERDEIDIHQAMKRIESQLPMAEKIARADVVLNNSSTFDFLYRQIDGAIQGKEGLPPPFLKANPLPITGV